MIMKTIKNDYNVILLHKIDCHKSDYNDRYRFRYERKAQ